jgi:hypothetical protein
VSGGSDFHGSNDDERNLGESYVTEKELEIILDKSAKNRTKPIFKHIISKLF